MGNRWCQIRDWLSVLLPPELSGAADELADTLKPWACPTPLEWHEGVACLLKREDLGRFATHKSRGLGWQVALGLREGARGFVISSSGNAAVAAGGWCQVLGTRCLAFLSDRTAPAKIAAVLAAGATAVVTPKPKNFSRYASRYGGLVDLRPSQDPQGALGYRTLSAELVAQLGAAPSAVFVFVNSGLTLLGLGEGFARLREAGVVATTPSLHAVQCTPSDALARALGQAPVLERDPVAGALGASVPAQLERLAGLIRESGGRLWMVRNDEVIATRAELDESGPRVAIESVAMLTGLGKARRELTEGDGPGLGALTVALVAGPERSLTGAARELTTRAHRATSYADVRALLEKLKMGRAGEAGPGEAS